MKKNSLMILKKICLCVMCVAFCACLFACSPISMSTTQYTSGEILFKMEFDISTLSGEQKEKALNLATGYHTQLTKAYKKNLVELFDNVYKDKAWWTMKGDDAKWALIKSAYPRFIACDRNTNETDGGDVFANTSIVAGATKIKVEIAFKSIYGYLAYFCPSAYKYDEDSNNIVIDKTFYSTLIDTPIMVLDSETENTFFATKMVETCSPFYYNKEQPKLLEDYSGTSKTYSKGELLETVAKEELGLTNEQASYVFSFITPYSRLHSNGTIESVEGGIKHTWTLDSLDENIKVYRNYARQVVYYVIGIGVGVVLMGVAIAISIVKTRKNKKQATFMETKIDDHEESPLSTQTKVNISRSTRQQDRDKTLFNSQVETPKRVRARSVSASKNLEKENIDLNVEKPIKETKKKATKVETTEDNLKQKSTTSKKTTKKEAKDNKTTKRRSKKIIDEQTVQNMSGLELLKAIDDLVKERENDNEEK